MPVGGAFSSLLQSLRKRTIRIGRGYQGQSFALIALCRHLVENDTNPRDGGLQVILQLADDALLAAEKAGKNKTPEADLAFKEIRTKLGRFPTPPTESIQKLFNDFMDAPSKDEVTAKRIKTADEKSSPTPKAGPSKKVTFVLRKSLHEDGTQIIFQKKLENTTTIPEILWILRHEEDDKRITWKQNPHFYSELPREARDFGRNFHREPLKDNDFRRALMRDSVPIYILSDKPCRLHLDDANPRVFGNVWHPHHKVILKDICGILDSEDNVHPPEEFDFLYRHESQPHGSSSDSCHSDVLRRIREESSWDWPQVLQVAFRCQDIDLMVRAKGREDVPSWNLLPPEVSPLRSESRISSAPIAPASTPTSSRLNTVLVDGPVDTSHSANVRRDAENGTRYGRPSDSQSCTSRKSQGSNSQSSLSSGAQKPGERSSQRERPITVRGFPAHSASQTSSSPRPPASTPTPSRLDDVPIDVPVNIPQERPTVREDAARGQRHAHTINNTREGRPSDSQSRTSSHLQGSDIPLSSGAQKHATTPGKSTTHYAAQNYNPPSILAIDSSTTSINMKFNIAQTTFVIPAATPPPPLRPAQKPAPPPRSKGWLQTLRDTIGW